MHDVRARVIEADPVPPRVLEPVPDPLRIVIVAPPWYRIPPRAYGGIEAVCGLLAEGLLASGHDVTLIGAGTKADHLPFRPTFERPPSGLGTEAAPWIELTHANRAAAALEELAPDVVHDHSLAGPTAAWGRAIPTVVTVHGPTPALSASYYASLSPGVALVAISNAQRMGAPMLPWAATVHNAIRLEDFRVQPTPDGPCLFLGRMNPDKGPHLAIDVARRAGRPIVLAGKCEEPVERAYFEREVLPRLGPGVEWVGEADLETKRELYARASSLLCPLQWDEPFGLVMVEAMASGTPVLAFRRGAAPEIVVDGVTGFIRDDPGGLVAALADLDRIDPVACREHVERKFGPATMVAAYERVYREVVQRSRVSANSVTGGR